MRRWPGSVERIPLFFDVSILAAFRQGVGKGTREKMRISSDRYAESREKVVRSPPLGI